MILEINQISANGKNLFEIIEGGQLLYQAHSPWLPMITDAARKITMSDPAGQKVFETNYSFLENMSEAIVPFKYLLTGAQKFNQYSVVDADGKTIGAFYSELNGLIDKKLYLQRENRAIVGYRRSVGNKEVVSFYQNERQVGQLTRSNSTVNNQDRYLPHFLPGYESWLPILAFFTVYYDFMYHNNSGKVMIGYSTKYVYTYDKNNKKYDKNFIRNNFGQAEDDRINGKGSNSMKAKASVGNLTMKQFWTIFGIGWGVAILTAVIILLIVFLL